ncbi:hypothetical protein ACFWOG_12305 [Kitasatospora sp. NPDC058406]|uniref:hypothetical protein n=1 Tax=Kitasatospora sp. NPDC058406 TaxID=3346483 RepID=UPI00365FD21E
MSLPTQNPPEPEPAPLLTVRTAIILLAGAFIGVIAGGLTYLSGGPAAGAVLAGLTGCGVSIPALHILIR